MDGVFNMLTFILLISGILILPLLALPTKFSNYPKERMSPKSITIGEPIWYEKDGKYYNCKTHKEVQIQSGTLAETIERIRNRK